MERALISVDVYGKFALFTNPQFKLDRLTYDVITPSAARGILCAIYSKPIEFYYEIKSIEIMKDIKYIDVTKNELKDGRISPRNFNSIIRSENNTQRCNRYLKDVYYRINAYIVKRPDFRGSIKSLEDQFNRRVEHGKCFYQPYLGTKECVAYFQPKDETMKPISLSKHFGISVYDIFDIRNNIPLTEKNANDVLNFTFYKVIMKNGVIECPAYEEVANGYA